MEKNRSQAIKKKKSSIFAEKVKPYIEHTNQLKKEVAECAQAIRKEPALASYYHVKSLMTSIARGNLLLKISDFSQNIQGVGIPSYLNIARRELTNDIHTLKKIFGNELTDSLSDNEEILEKYFSYMTINEKFNLISTLRDILIKVKFMMGDSSKWRWSFPHIFYNFLILAKGLFHFKEYFKMTDPSDSDYQPMQDYITLLLEELSRTAQDFRSLYEIATHDISDLHIIRRIFELELKIHKFLENEDSVQKVQNLLDSLKAQIESEMVNKDKKKKLF